MKRPIAVAEGDGIGPEIMQAALSIMEAAGAELEIRKVDMGRKFYDQGYSTGMTEEARRQIEEIGILFKGPMETPKGSGMKSINVTARKVWSTYANKRVFRSLNGVETVFSRSGIPIDITMVRENIEDTYGSIEHMLTPDVALCRRFITYPGSLQVHRYAFEMARRKGARKVTCGHKSNIMKLTDGLFLEAFYAVAKDYPELQVNDIIVDDLAMKLVTKPQDFDVIVLPNLQGDILSDLCAGLVGGLGFAPSANIGDQISIFEAVHGTAPDIAGKNLANPTSLLLSGIMMLRHIGQSEKAANIENALLYTLEQGFHTADFGTSAQPSLSTSGFADKIIANLGLKPHINPAKHILSSGPEFQKPAAPLNNKMMVAKSDHNARQIGFDLFIESDQVPNVVGDRISTLLPPNLKLVTMSNRGTQVYPSGSVFTECINQYRVRIELLDDSQQLSTEDVFSIAAVIGKEIRICSIEMLMIYHGKKAYSLAQGQ